MDTSSYFINNKAIFGSYPSQEEVELLESIGVRYFIDLTDIYTEYQKIITYTTKYSYLSYPIKDHCTPSEMKSFAVFIVKICSIIKKLDEGEQIFVHCIAGHGRSGIVVACILCFLFDMEPSTALKYTSFFHNRRKEMKDKWRKIGSPQTVVQKKFVHNFFKPLILNYRDESIPFSNFAKIPVFVPGFGYFKTAEAAYQVHRNVEDVLYIENQKKSENAIDSLKLSKHVDTRADWEEIKYEIMSYIVGLKMIQNAGTRNSLLSTFICPIQ